MPSAFIADAFPGAGFFVWRGFRLPFHADVLGLCAGRDPRTRRGGGSGSGGEADLPLSSVGRLRPRSRAKSHDSKWKFTSRNLISWIKQESLSFRFARCCSVWWFFEQNKARAAAGAVCGDQSCGHGAAPVAATNSSVERPHSATVNRRQWSRVPVVFDTNAPEQTIVLANAKARYTFTSRGGGLKLVELLNLSAKRFPPAGKTKTARSQRRRFAEHAHARCPRWRCWAIRVWLATEISL